jgi:hypothetical protein
MLKSAYLPKFFAKKVSISFIFFCNEVIIEVKLFLNFSFPTVLFTPHIVPFVERNFVQAAELCQYRNGQYVQQPPWPQHAVFKSPDEPPIL